MVRNDGGVGQASGFKGFGVWLSKHPVTVFLTSYWDLASASHCEGIRERDRTRNASGRQR
jgi:hypothetical protein